MATKVKGGAIKEGSIPLSALSEEIKNKIENAGGSNTTPDWNAKEGSVGYIKNRTHYRIQIPLSTTNYTFIEDFPKYYDTDTDRYYSKQDVHVLYTEDDRDYPLIIPANTLLGYADNSNKVNIEINSEGEIFKFESYLDEHNVFIKVKQPNYGDNFRLILYTQLDEWFIPNTIARKSNMATINGESITNGGNIEIKGGSSVTPDWNASEGEDGYINNRTHYKKELVDFYGLEDSYWDEDVETFNHSFYIEVNRDKIIDSISFSYNNKESEDIIISDTEIDFETSIQVTSKDIYDFKGSISIEDYGKYKVIHITAHCDSECSNLKANIKELKLVKLSEDFIPDTIARKSDIIAFDPVVWKYICDPLVIRHGDTVPSELLNDEGYIKTEYRKRGMYTLSLNNEIPNYEDYFDNLMTSFPPTRVSDLYVECYNSTINGDGVGIFASPTYNEENNSYYWEISLSAE